MTDNNAIIEAAVRALAEGGFYNRGSFAAAKTILAAVTPLIEANALERAAVIIENDDGYSSSTAELAAAIRALKEQP